MPTIPHEAPLELVRRNPQLVAVLLRGLGVPVPDGADAHLLPADQTASVLLVICPNARTARRCRTPISMGHPGWELTPLVIDATTVPPPGRTGTASAVPELVVLRVLTGALNLEQDSVRRQVLAELAKLDDDRRTIYTVFIRRAASGLAGQALEELMATTHPFRDQFVDRWLAEGEAKGRVEGEAQMILRVLAARGVAVPADARRQLLSCTDAGQLARWGDRAATATSAADVFSA